MDEQLEEQLATLLAGAAFRGVVRIERDSSLLVEHAHGVDGDAATLSSATVFQTASVSKSFVAASALALVQSGLLDLDAELGSVLDEAPSAWRGITIRQLIAHTSGLPHWSDIDGLDPYRAWQRRELIARLAAAPLRFEPGCGWHYSSPNYLLLAHIVELVSGVPFAAFLATNVLEPLGLTSTAASGPPRGVRVARGCASGAPVRSWDLSLLFDHVWSNAADLARWPCELARSSFFRLDDGTTAFDPLAVLGDVDGLTDVGYAYGWFTGRLDGRRVVLHPGDQPGVSTLVMWAPDAGITVAALAAETVDLGELLLPMVAQLTRTSLGSDLLDHVS